MLANAFDGRCIDSGGAWCTAATLWDTDTGRYITLGMVLCVILFVVLSIRLAMSQMNAVGTVSSEDDVLRKSFAARLAEQRKKHAEVEE